MRGGDKERRGGDAEWNTWKEKRKGDKRRTKRGDTKKEEEDTGEVKEAKKS